MGEVEDIMLKFFMIFILILTILTVSFDRVSGNNVAWSTIDAIDPYYVYIYEGNFPPGANCDSVIGGMSSAMVKLAEITCRMPVIGLYLYLHSAGHISWAIENYLNNDMCPIHHHVMDREMDRLRTLFGVV